MATITLSLSSYASGTSSSFKSSARVQVDYSIGVGSVYVSNVRCLAGNGYRSYESGSITVKVGNTSKTISGVVDFGASSYTQFANFNFTASGLGSSASISVSTSTPSVSNIKASTFSGSIGGITQVTKPTLSSLTTSSLTDTSVKASFSITNTGNGSCDKYIDIFTDSGLSKKIGTINNTSGTFSDLDPNRSYWIRGNSGNSAGRTYTNTVKITTTYTNPGAPKSLVISHTETSPIPKSQLKANWVAASAGSTPVEGYILALYKNNEIISAKETSGTGTSYNFGTFESLGFEPGDIAKVSIYAYAFDWEGNKHINGNGEASAQVFSSNTITVVSDKYIYVSEDGGAFEKRKIYVSVDGASFIEIKKEQFNVIE